MGTAIIITMTRLLFVCCWCLVRGGDVDPPEYDDYYDHDVSGLLEDDG